MAARCSTLLVNPVPSPSSCPFLWPHFETQVSHSRKPLSCSRETSVKCVNSYHFPCLKAAENSSLHWSTKSKFLIKSLTYLPWHPTSLMPPQSSQTRIWKISACTRLSHTTLFTHLISFLSVSSFPSSAWWASLLFLFSSGVNCSETLACFPSPPKNLAFFSFLHPETLCLSLCSLQPPSPTTLHLLAEIFMSQKLKIAASP